MRGGGRAKRALALLYEAEQKDLALTALLAELPAAPEKYAAELVVGVASKLGELDAMIELHANEWALDRMPAIDRALLRLGAYELVADVGVPVAVVIDEAVELAKAYSTDESGRFINGVLSAIAAEVRPPSEVAR